MKFLANENLPLPSVNLLRESGHEVFSITESCHGISDEEVLANSRKENLTILTFDRDYSELIFVRKHSPPPAIFFFRLEPESRIKPFLILQNTLNLILKSCNGCFVVINRKSVRMREMKSEI